ncbi:modulator of DNA gyrase family protein [Clostridiales bacterium oral taxon 876 str. F0540]|nr:modulator of DNA gyrase family protein [Clostridiales bacterium oral taxon 876 str. F0540]
MIDKIRQILSTIKDISGYKIVETKIESGELFFVRKGLDMNRGKSVHYFSVTVYKDFEEDNTKYRGSSTTTIHPTMHDDEIFSSLNDGAFAAGFIKNEYYPLVKPYKLAPLEISTNLYGDTIENWLPKITAAVYKADTLENGWINSTEVFLNKVFTRIINSEGVDVSFENYKGEVEFITDWKENGEDIELYKRFDFSEFNYEEITEIVKEQLKISRDKAIAKPTPALGKYTVLLTGGPAEEMFSFYSSQSSAQDKYNHTSNAELNKNIQGDEVNGDLINMTLDPQLTNSSNSVPYDMDGFQLKPVKIFENGILKRFWGDIRHSHYLNIEPTGLIRNIVVEGGKHSAEEFRKEPYLELVAFSDFQMDGLTGDFGGEIRLGWYFDGEKTIPVTGGSISGNIKEVQKNLYFSKELQKNNGFYGPKTIKLLDVSVSGIE